MMTQAWLRFGMVAAIALGLVAVWLVFRLPLLTVAGFPPGAAIATQPLSGAVPNLDSAIAKASGRPLFRSDRRAALVAFSADAPAEAQAAGAAPVPKPAIALSGIVWGRDPVAILEGVPGSEGSTVLRAGGRAPGLRVVRIGRERVIVEGFDTTWTLTVREPWP